VKTVGNEAKAIGPYSIEQFDKGERQVEDQKQE